MANHNLHSPESEDQTPGSYQQYQQPHQDPNAPQYQQYQNQNQFAEEVREFYQRNFKALFLAFFSDPVNGLFTFLSNPPAKAFTHSMILYGSVFVLYLTGSYILVGDMRDYMDLSTFLAFGLAPVLVMLTISFLSYLFKLMAGSANFQSELLTGALCGIPIALFIPVLMLFRLFGEDGQILFLLSRPLAVGGVLPFIMLYLFLMMANVFQQSLKSGRIGDVLAWYLSPISVMLAMYMGFSIMENLLR